MPIFQIYHTNDIHSNFEAYSKIIQTIRQDFDVKKDFLFDLGDFNDFKSTLVSGTNGLGGMEILKQAQVDAMAIGNNEFFGGPHVLDGMSQNGVPMISCNIRYLDGSPIGDVTPYIILEKQGIRFLIVGVCPYWGESEQANAFTKMVKIQLFDPIKSLKACLKQVKEEYDFVICLSHAGYKQDVEIAQAIPEIQLILGGHSHTDMQLEKVNQTYIYQAKCYGEVVGRIELSFQNGTYEITGTYVTPQPISAKDIDQVIEKQQEKGIANLKKELYRISQPLPFQLDRPCPFMNVLVDALAMYYPCDFALCNHGIFEHGLETSISKYALLSCAPSPLNPTLVQWTGKQIHQAIFESLTPEFIYMEQHAWPGYRGKYLGTISVSHNVQIDMKTRQIFINQQPLQMDQIYTVLTNDSLQRGKGYSCLGLSKGKTEFYSGFFRDFLEECLKDPKVYAYKDVPRLIGDES